MTFEDIKGLLTLLVVILFPIIELFVRKRRLAEMEKEEAVPVGTKESAPMPPVPRKPPARRIPPPPTYHATPVAKAISPEQRIVQTLLEAVHGPLHRFSEAHDLRFRSNADRLRHNMLATEPLKDIWTSSVIATEVCGSFVRGVPGLKQEMYARLDMPPQAIFPRSPRDVDPSHIQAFFGSWFDDMAQDAVSTLFLGPGYALSLLHEPSNEVPLSWYREDGSINLSGLRSAPMAVRIHTALWSLEAMGMLDEQQRLIASHPQDVPQRLLFPSLEGFLEVPYDLVSAMHREIVFKVITHRYSSLAEHSFKTVPGFAYTFAVHRASRRVAGALLEGSQPSADDTRAWWVATMMATDRRASQAQQLFRHFKTAVLAHQQAKSAWHPSKRARPSVARTEALDSLGLAASLRQAFQSPHELRASVLLGEAICPPKSNRTEGVRTGRP